MQQGKDNLATNRIAKGMTALALAAALLGGPAEAGERGRLTEARPRPPESAAKAPAETAAPEAGSPQAAPTQAVEQSAPLPPALDSLDISASDLPGAKPAPPPPTSGPAPASQSPAPISSVAAPPASGMAAAALEALSGAALPSGETPAALPSGEAPAATPAQTPEMTAPTAAAPPMSAAPLPPSKPAEPARAPGSAPPEPVASPAAAAAKPEPSPPPVKAATPAMPAATPPAAAKAGPVEPAKAAEAEPAKPRTSDEALQQIISRNPPRGPGPIDIQLGTSRPPVTSENAVKAPPARPRPNPTVDTSTPPQPPALAPSLPLRFGPGETAGVPVLTPSPPVSRQNVVRTAPPAAPAAPPSVSTGGCPAPGQGDEATRFTCLQQQATAGQAIAQMMQANSGNAALQATISGCLNRFQTDLNAALACARGENPPPTPVALPEAGGFVAPSTQAIDPGMLARMGVPALPDAMPAAPAAAPAAYPGLIVPPLSATGGAGLPASPFAVPNTAAADLRGQLQQLCTARWPGRFDQQASCMNDMLAASQRLLGFAQQYPVGSRGNAILTACRSQWGIQLDLATRCVDEQIQSLLRGG